MVAAAREQAAGLRRHLLPAGRCHGNRPAGGRPDIVFERALIHHLKDYRPCFAEARRVLVPGGSLIVQDRTPDDVQLPGSTEHVRGYFFECFPRLLAVEAGPPPDRCGRPRCPAGRGFSRSRERHAFWELRKTHENWQGLSQDLTNRTGRSILHDLSDKELAELIVYIEKRLPSDGAIVEKDRWTVWSAVA